MILSLCVFMPLGAAALLTLVPPERLRLARLLGIAATATSLLLATMMLLGHGKTALGDSAESLFAGRVSEVLEEVSSDPNDRLRKQLQQALVAHPLPGDPRLEGLEAIVTPSSRTHLDLYYDAIELSLSSQSRLASQVRFVEHYPWVEALNVHYFVGVDGISLPLIWVIALISFLVSLHAWQIKHATRGYVLLVMVATTGLLGTLAALDFFLLLTFLQLVLAPMFLLVGGWGGPGRNAASFRSFISVQVGCLLLLLVMLGFQSTPPEIRSFNLLALSTMAEDPTVLPADFQSFALVTLLAGLAFLVPVFPLHTWLKSALCDAPAGASALIVGGLIAVGGYAVMRLGCGLCPQVFATGWGCSLLGTLGLIGLFYGGLCAMMERQLGGVVAHASLSASGLFLVGLAALSEPSMAGAALQMCNQLLAVALLMLGADAVGRRAGTPTLGAMARLGRKRHALRGALVLGMLALLGMPGMGTFAARLLVVVGAWNSEAEASERGGTVFLPQWMSVVALAGLVLAAGYALPWIRALIVGESGYADDVDPAAGSERAASASAARAAGAGSSRGRSTSAANQPSTGSRQRQAAPRPPATAGSPVPPDVAPTIPKLHDTERYALAWRSRTTAGSPPLAGEEDRREGDLGIVEFLTLAPLAATLVLLGVLPQLALSIIEPTTRALLALVTR